MDAKSLIKLNFHKNAKDEFHCPVLYKVLTKNSHFVTVATTGNVFSYEVRLVYGLGYSSLRGK